MQEDKSILNQIDVKKTVTPGDDFFDDIATSVLASESKQNKIIPFYKKPIFKWLSAAAILLPIFIYIGLKNQTTREIQTLAIIDTLTRDEIKSYLNKDKIILPVETIENQTSNQTNPQIAIQTNDQQIDPFESLNSEDIKAYFLFEEIDNENEEESSTFI